MLFTYLPCVVPAAGEEGYESRQFLAGSRLRNDEDAPEDRRVSELIVTEPARLPVAADTSAGSTTRSYGLLSFGGFIMLPLVPQRCIHNFSNESVIEPPRVGTSSSETTLSVLLDGIVVSSVVVSFSCSKRN